MDRLIINIGRQFGSGGKLVAEALGARLGIQVYDHELIQKAAEDSGFNPRLFKRYDENKRVFDVASVFSQTPYGPINQSGICDSSLYKIQCDVIRKIAGEGSAIFVGRASNYVLRDMDCLDVFVCAPMAVRVQRVSERLGIGEEEAVKMIRKKDKAREEYYNFYTFGDWGMASNYDLCLDSSILGIDGTADFIIDFLRRTGKNTEK